MSLLTLEILKEHEKQLNENGYFTFDALDKELIVSIKDNLEKQLRIVTQLKEVTLENYHKLDLDDQKHYRIQYEMTKFYREQGFGQKIIESNARIFRGILGPDIEVQTQPYLRMVRPGASKDNIGYHRDTFYGTSAHELSVLIPFVDLPKDNTLSIYPGSHLLPDKNFKVKIEDSPDVQKGDIRNQAGFLYRHHKMDEEINQFMKPIELNMGKILVFILSAVHGSIHNGSLSTRWSSDIRIKNTFHPAGENLKEGYYKPFEKSVILKCAEKLN